MYIPVDMGRKLNVHKTFRRRLGRLTSTIVWIRFEPPSIDNLPLYISTPQDLLSQGHYYYKVHTLLMKTQWLTPSSIDNPPYMD